MGSGEVISGQQLALWRAEAQKEAIAANVPPTEVDWLLQEVAGLDRLSLRLAASEARSQISLQQPLAVLNRLWQQRLQKHTPVQYLVGATPWRNFSLKVAPGVLIPRPETELIVDLALEAIKQSSQTDLASGHWVDLGTGSGAIAIALAKTLTKTTIHAVDLSADALAIAKQNAIDLGADRIQFYQGSWWLPLKHLMGEVSGMVSNPPYIPTDLISQLQPEVAQHEPYLALNGGGDGLDCIRHLVKTAPDYLRPGGIWLIEMMSGQAEPIVKLLQDSSYFEKIQIFPDLAGIDRFALAYKRD